MILSPNGSETGLLNKSIWILEDDKKAVEFSKAADTKHIIALTEPVVKPYLVHLKEI